MFDSPFDYCNVCRDNVLLDQTHLECVREHNCDNISKCSLEGCFTGIEFGTTKGNAEAESARDRD